MAPVLRSAQTVGQQVDVVTDAEVAEEIEEVNERVPARKRGQKTNDRKNRTCAICNRVFSKPIHMKNHLPVHDPDRLKITCPVLNCNSQYNDVKNWRPHFLSKHAKGPAVARQRQLEKAEEKLTLVSLFDT